MRVVPVRSNRSDQHKIIPKYWQHLHDPYTPLRHWQTAQYMHIFLHESYLQLAAHITGTVDRGIVLNTIMHSCSKLYKLLHVNSRVL